MKLTLITTPKGDWEMLYVNNDKVKEGYNIGGKNLLLTIRDLQPLAVESMECKTLTSVAQRELEPRFPECLSEYNHEQFHQKGNAFKSFIALKNFLINKKHNGVKNDEE